MKKLKKIIKLLLIIYNVNFFLIKIKSYFLNKKKNKMYLQ